jgi:multicomponent Na+:H+ antiporter subunit E
MHKVKPGIILFVILFGLWLLLAGADRDELIVAAVASLVISILFAGRVSALGSIRLHPKAIAYAVIFFFVFLRELVHSTIDVAGRLLSPRLPINPGIVKVRTRLKSPLGRIILANTITLTPGTMTVETKGEYYYIHWIDIRTEDIDSSTEAIVAKFEKYLEVIFG